MPLHAPMQAPGQATPSAPSAPSAPPGQPIFVATPQAIYQAARAKVNVLRDQLSALEDKRSELARQMQGTGQTAATKLGLEKRIAEIDVQISDVDKQIAGARSEVAKTASIPGAAVEPPSAPRNGPPEEAYALGALFLCVVLLPISLAFARRIWRRSAKATVVMPAEASERLAAIEQAVEAVALEVERIGEGQRFVTQLLADAPARGLGAGAAQPISLKAAEGVRQER